MNCVRKRRYGSMSKLQDKSISEKEKKRDMAIRREKKNPSVGILQSYLGVYKCRKEIGGNAVLWCKAKLELASAQIVPNFILLKGERSVNLWEIMSKVLIKAYCSMLLGGDLMTIRNRGERSGCKGLSTCMKEFYEIIENYNMLVLPLFGNNSLGSEPFQGEVG
ncbi:hypothetical protein V6N13_019828 [Hibiscus sabdariffa]